MMRRRSTMVLAIAVAALAPQTGLQAQSFRRGGTEFNALRSVTIPTKDVKPVMVTQFFHHGQIADDGGNVMVLTRNQKAVPCRVLQLGPGDFCRLAFQTLPGQTTYEVYYGGEPPEKGEVPPWTNRDGLMLETRRYKECNLNQLDSVRKAFESSQRIGSDYVDNVQHARNPFSLVPGPFLSHYSGQLHVGSAGTYGFMVSSQDCSFLLIDGKEVVSAPGRHGPLRQAKPGMRKDIKLAAGAHRFDFYHAATGTSAMMVAAWEVSPPVAKPKPVAIPTEAFRTGSIGRVEAGSVKLREMKLAPDFLVGIRGDVPLPDNDQALVGVVFKDMSPKSLTMGGMARWDFGDGQTSSENNPGHVYLRPGLYTVKLSTGRRTARPIEIVNRILIERPSLTRKDEKTFHKLDDYLPILETYDPTTLDAVSLRQLLEAYLWKSDLVQMPPEPPEAEPEEGAEPPEPVAPTPEQIEAQLAEAKTWVAKAVAAGKVPFVGESAAKGDKELTELARLVGPLARSGMGNSQLAYEIWIGAKDKIAVPEMKAECEIEAADIAINDLLKSKLAKPLLEAASKRIPERKMGPVASRLKLAWGDYYAATGDGKAARKAYVEAEQILGTRQTHLERTAWRGAHSRSTEDYLKDGELERAAAELRLWEVAFPSEKLDGYITLLHARYWVARKMYPQAIALCEQLLTVAPDSPYADQLLLLAANCEVSRGNVEAAVATLQSLVKDYPGSPLVPAVRNRIQQLESGEVDKPTRPPRRKPSS